MRQSSLLPMEEAVAGAPILLPVADDQATEVTQTPKQPPSLATKSRSLPPQQEEAQGAAVSYPLVRSAALPPCPAVALVRQFLAVRQTAALSAYQALRLVVAASGKVMSAHLSA